MVMVGATNVGRIKVVGDALDLPRRFGRGEELARFEMGSTVVLVSAPDAVERLPALVQGASVRLGQRIATWRARAGALRA
jgi:phosphatidylserine decarboxylase